MTYVRISEGLNNYKLVPSTDDIWKHIKTSEKDYYVSLFDYNQTHYDQWKKTKSISGIKDTITNKLFFDFDNTENIELARKDAVILVERLTSKGINPDNVQIAFSGNKGFSVGVDTTRKFTPEEFKQAVFALAGDLPTFDTVVNDPNRIVRVVGTKHPKSGLYKLPLTKDQLGTLDVENIKQLATSIDNVDVDILDKWTPVELAPDVIPAPKVKETPKIEVTSNGIDESRKPRFLDMPRWYLQNGFFKEGERNSAFLCLAATYKNLGFEKQHTYRLLKGVAEIQADRNNSDPYPHNELWNNIISLVYSDLWQGGQFSLKDENSWLFKYAQKYGIKIEETASVKPMIMSELGGDSFARYAKSFYETRIYTGLKDLDEAFPICAGSNVAIVGAASSGKTALTLNILRESNKQNVISVFASLDMAKSRLYEKMLYSVTGGTKSRDEIYQAYINGEGHKYDAMVKEAFPNTFVFSKSSPTVDEVRKYIESVQDHTGNPVRLLMVDYFERLGSEKSDDTAASKDVAGHIQDLISDFPELTPITLYQPNKFALGGGPDKPILNYGAIKGSSFIYQSARQILSLWRPMFTPDLKDDDKYMEMAVLKNDLGELGKFCYNWHGKTGSISMMSDYDRVEYEEAMKRKAEIERKLKGDSDDI